MKLGGKPLTISQVSKPIAVLILSSIVALVFISISNPTHNPNPNRMAAGPKRSFILWLHGLGDSGPANEPIKTFFTSPQFINSKWSFPSAPPNPVTCNSPLGLRGELSKHEVLFTHSKEATGWEPPYEHNLKHSPNDETSLLKAVKQVHTMIDKEVDSGISPENIFVCGFSQGGALTLASVLLYPRTLGGGAVFSGWIPFNHSIIEQFPADAKKTPILWSHGLSDPTVLFEAGQAGVPFLEKAGVKCEFKAYPGLGHSISPEELKNLESWINSRLESSS